MFAFDPLRMSDDVLAWYGPAGQLVTITSLEQLLVPASQTL